MTAPASGEASPVEAAAEALANARHEAKKTGRGTWPWDDIAHVALAAGLAGDWLERVAWEHRDLGLIRQYSAGVFRVCATCGNVPDIGRPGAHQAAAVRAYATGVGL